MSDKKLYTVPCYVEDGDFPKGSVAHLPIGTKFHIEDDDDWEEVVAVSYPVKGKDAGYVVTSFFDNRVKSCDTLEEAMKVRNLWISELGHNGMTESSITVSKVIDCTILFQ
jgi:hypothetical protein